MSESTTCSNRALFELNAEMQTRILDQVQDAIVAVDREFHVTYCNSAAERLFGWPAAEAVGRVYRTIAGTQVSPAERQAIHHEILQRGSWSGEIICTHKAGTQFLARVSWSVIRDTRGAPRQVIGIHQDLTTPKQMEQKLRATEDVLRVAQDTLGVGTWEWDLGPGMPKCSEQLIRLCGFHGDWRDFSYDDWLSCVHPDDRSRICIQVAAHRNQPQAFVEQYRVVWPDGSVHWILDRSMLVAGHNGQPERMIGLSVDITDQKNVEHASAQLAAIVECADASIISTNLQGEVLTWNRGAERMYGYCAAEMLGRSTATLVPPERAEEWASIQRQLRRGESVHHLETSRLTKSGSRIDVLHTISPILDRNGIVQGMAGVAWDITQIKRLERQLAQTQKMESIGQLAAGIAHEINTPIQYIGDNAKFLQDAFHDLIGFATQRPEPQHMPTTLEDGVFEYLRNEVPRAIEQLLEGVDHVARIVRAMKEFSHPGPAEKMPVDINRAIESTILVSKNEWKYIAEVSTDLEPDLPLVPCLAGELNQVILNLIVNAAHAIAEFNKDSGRKGSIHITTCKSTGGVEIHVRDTGGGIPEAIQSKVFDPFFTTKPMGKGTGQGLAIAHAVIVQKHNGTIRFESEPGSGTRFVIGLPLERELVS
ncbi:MAG: hypothetical protein C5B51_24230 [Terriglobia bacterium]|nr:MAG: hypothetical protein C5B51_24230 [Terriglobia bacterium]